MNKSTCWKSSPSSGWKRAPPPACAPWRCSARPPPNDRRTRTRTMAVTRNKSASGRRGVLAGGNWIIDQVKLIDVYPQREQLANILSQSQGTGGAPYNVLIDLARLGAAFPLYGAGLVGKDGLGQYILEDCKRHKIDSRLLRTTGEAPTSFTDVMTEQSNGKRTFFH